MAEGHHNMSHRIRKIENHWFKASRGEMRCSLDWWQFEDSRLKNPKLTNSIRFKWDKCRKILTAKHRKKLKNMGKCLKFKVAAIRLQWTSGYRWWKPKDNGTLLTIWKNYFQSGILYQYENIL